MRSFLAVEMRESEQRDCIARRRRISTGVVGMI
jgi:hypothetical protein